MLLCTHHLLCTQYCNWRCTLHVAHGCSLWRCDGAATQEIRKSGKHDQWLQVVWKEAQLAESLDGSVRAQQAQALHLELMKWRAAPTLDLEAIACKRCLVLGALESCPALPWHSIVLCGCAACCRTYHPCCA